jgi:hypothetical protein
LKKRVVNGLFRGVAGLLPQSYVDTTFDPALYRSDYEVGLTSEMIALQKTGPDTRDSHWYRPF